MTGHLIHIGYPKAGSTYLQQWFAAHPQLHFCDGGIAGFRSVFDAMQFGANTARSPRYFVTSSESLSLPRTNTGLGVARLLKHEGRKTPAAAQLHARDELARIFPNAHILIVTRGFHSMILSSYSQYVRAGGSRGIDVISTAAADGTWAYDRLVTSYRAAFGDRVIVLPYELLAENPSAFRGEIERRLGLDPFEYSDARANTALSPRELFWYPRLARGLERMPGGERLRARFVGLTYTNRLARPIALLDRLWPGVPVTRQSVPQAYVEAHRGLADALAAEPLYRRYADAYLAPSTGDTR